MTDSDIDSDSDCSERQGVIRIFPRYEEISSFPPNGVERFQFSTRTGHYSQVVNIATGFEQIYLFKKITTAIAKHLIMPPPDRLGLHLAAGLWCDRLLQSWVQGTPSCLQLWRGLSLIIALTINEQLWSFKAGNLSGGKMYSVGRACSSCPAGTSCSSTFPGLCSEGAGNQVGLCLTIIKAS